MEVIGITNGAWKEHIWFSKLVSWTKFDAKTVRKSIKRCIEREWLEEYKLVSKSKTWKGDGHQVRWKGYRWTKKFIRAGRKHLSKQE